MGAPDAYREDLAQDVFVVVHRRLHEFDGKNLAGWLYQIARRRVRDFRHSLWFRQQFIGPPIDAVSCRVVGPQPSDALETKRSCALLHELLEELQEHERVALVLFEVDGASGEEIARTQGVSIHTAFSRVRRARLKLKAALSARDAQSPGPASCRLQPELRASVLGA